MDFVFHQRLNTLQLTSKPVLLSLYGSHGSGTVRSFICIYSMRELAQLFVYITFLMWDDGGNTLNSERKYTLWFLTGTQKK